MSLTLFRRGSFVRARLICFDLDVYLGTFFELDLATVTVNQAIRDTNFPVQVIRTFDCDLGFFGFPAPWVRSYDLFYLSWERSAGFRLFF